MLLQRNKLLGIILFICLVSIAFLIKNTATATIDATQNIITGNNITATNITSYDVNFQFSGTLDEGDIVTVELIDISSTSIVYSYTGIGGETGVTINFDASALAQGIFTISGSVVDSGGSLMTGPITGSALLDTIIPTFDGVASGTYYSGDVGITFDDTNISGATLNGNAYTSGDAISSEGVYIFIVTDIVGNSTGATFTIDKTAPTFTGATSGTYYNTDQSITFSDTNISGATLNGASYISATTITTDNVYIFFVSDLAGNSTGATFTLDKTAPTVSQGYISAGNTGINGSTGYYNGTIDIRATVIDSGTTLNTGTCEYSLDGASRVGASFDTGGYCYANGITPASDINILFRIADLVGNTGTSITGTYLYDVTQPTATDDANSTTGRVDVTVAITAIDTGVGISGALYCVDTNGTCTPNLVGTSVLVTGATNAITHKYVRYYAVDKLNNTGDIETSLEINIDKETPLLTGTTTFTSNNTTNTGFAKVGDTITVLFQSHETLGAIPILTISGAIYTGTVTNIGGNNYSGTYVMRSTDVEGAIKFTVSMTDLVGNTGTVGISSTIIFDRTNPSGISITSPTNTTYFQGGTLKTITWNTGTDSNFATTPIVIDFSDDNFNTIYATIASGIANDGSYNRTFPVLNTTIARVRIRAYDKAGNMATFTGNQFIIDSTKPSDVSILAPIGGEFFKGGSGYTISWTGGTDNFLSGKLLEYSLAGTFPGTTIYLDTANTFSYLRTTPSSNSNSVKLRITVTDRAGQNTASETATFTIDSTSPTAIVFSDSNSNWRNTSATATGTSSDALAGLRTTGVVYRTDTTFTTMCEGGSVTPPTFTSDGYRTGYACVLDKAGNIRTGQQLYKIDKTAPLLNMGSNKITNTGTTINITATGDISGISGYVRSQISGPGTVSFTTATSEDPTASANTDGAYTLQVIVVDNASNTTTGTISFIRDTVAPLLNGATGVLNTSNPTPNYSFTGTEAGTISYSGSCSSSTTTATSGANTITFSSLANATYSNCSLRVTDSAGNASARLAIPSFTVNYSAPSGGGGGGGGGGGIALCTNSQLMCSNGIYIKKTGVICAGGNLDKPCGTDVCVDGDYSGDPYDGLCKDSTKVEASTGSTSTGRRVSRSSPFSKELTDAYFYAYNIKITTVDDITRANMTGVLIRAHLAKMMSEYAIKVLGKEPDTTRNCSFSDMQSQTTELQNFAVTACQLGLMGLKTDGTPATKFNPQGQVTRAIFGTTLSRVLRGDTYNGGQDRYSNHLDALFAKGIISKKNNPLNRELRGYVMLMMWRADKYVVKSAYLDFPTLRGTRTFVPNRQPTTTNASGFTATELNFIATINKNYQFTEGYTANQASAGVKYLQYFLRAKKYYNGVINGINNSATIEALFQFQLDNNIVANETSQGAGFLGPTTREIINPLLKEFLNA